MAKLTWQRLARDNDDSHIVTYRAKVPGGWLVSVWAATSTTDATGDPIPGGSNWGGGLTFVAGSEQEWDVEIDGGGKRSA
jgi:hypothetical protein